MALLKLLFLLGCISNISGELFQARAYVDTSQGLIIGKISKSRNATTFFEFLGIPYGTVKKRFEISKPADGWTGARDATTYGASCIQISGISGVVSGEEDCLFLNVYKPETAFKHFKRNATRKLAVIFAIHDGGFTTGNGDSLRPEYLIGQDVIIVTPNYRLGPMGFLNAGVESATGNQGLKDLVLALQWVKLNIEKFGGDPDRVTIQGSGSASYAVSYLTLSPMAKGLFAGAISQGGTALCPKFKQFKPNMAISNAKKLANLLDCPSSNPSYLVKCLERLDPKILLEQTRVSDPLLFDVSQPAFGPSLETFQREDSDPNVFLSQDPYEVLEKGTFNRVPYILGVNSEDGAVEASLVLKNQLARRMNEEWGRIAPNTFIYEEYALDPCIVSGQIRELYFKGQNISAENSGQLAAAYGDRLSFQCTRNTALLYAKHAPIYLYNFNRKRSSKCDCDVTEPSNISMNRFLFPNNENIDNNSSDYDFSEKLSHAWTSFAKNGQPRSKSWLNGRKWEIFNPTEPQLKWLTINDNPEVKVEDFGFTSRMKFWNGLPLKEKFEKQTSVESEVRSAFSTTTETTIPSTNETSSTTNSNSSFTLSSTTTPTSKPSSKPTETSRSSSTTSRSQATINTYTTSTSSPDTSFQSSSAPSRDSRQRALEVPQELHKTQSNESTTKTVPIVMSQTFDKVQAAISSTTETNVSSTVSTTAIPYRPSPKMTPASRSSPKTTTASRPSSTTSRSPTTINTYTTSTIPPETTSLSRESSQRNLEAIKELENSSQTSEVKDESHGSNSTFNFSIEPIAMSQTFETQSSPSKNTTSKLNVSTYFAFNGTIVLSLLFPSLQQNVTQ